MHAESHFLPIAGAQLQPVLGSNYYTTIRSSRALYIAKRSHFEFAVSNQNVNEVRLAKRHTISAFASGYR